MGFQKKKGERSSPASNEECRGVYEVGGSLGYWQTNALINFPLGPKKPGGKGQRRRRTVWRRGPTGVRNLCGLPDGGETFALNLSGPNNFGFSSSFFFR